MPNFPHAQITFVNALLFYDVYFVFFNNCMSIIVYAIVLHLTFAFGIYLSNKEISKYLLRPVSHKFIY